MIKKTLIVFEIAALLMALPAAMFADSIILSPPDFLPGQGSGIYIRTNDALHIEIGSPVIQFYAPVHLPDGARITSVVLFYKDYSATNNVTVWLAKKNIYTGNAITMAYWSSSANSSIEPLIHKISPIEGENLVNNSGYIYNVSFFVYNTTANYAVGVYAVKINYK